MPELYQWSNAWTEAKKVYDSANKDIEKYESLIKNIKNNDIDKHLEKASKKVSKAKKNFDKCYESDGNESRQAIVDNLETKVEEIDGLVTKIDEVKTEINEKIRNLKSRRADALSTMAQCEAEMKKIQNSES